MDHHGHLDGTGWPCCRGLLGLPLTPPLAQCQGGARGWRCTSWLWGEPTGPCLPFPATLGPRASPTLVTLPPARAGHLAPATRHPSWPAGLTGEVALEASLGFPGLGRGSRDWQVHGARQDFPQQTWRCRCQDATPQSRPASCSLGCLVPGTGPAYHSHLLGQRWRTYDT